MVGLGAVWLLYELCVATATGQRLDDWLMREVADRLSARTGLADAFLSRISFTTCALAAAIISIAPAVGGHSRRAMGALACAVGVAAVAEVLKGALVRPDLAAIGASNSFPSGHVAAVAGLVAAAVTATAPPCRWLTLVAGAPVVAMTGLAVIAAEWHRPSDVLASACLGLSAGGVGTALCDR